MRPGRPASADFLPPTVFQGGRASRAGGDVQTPNIAETDLGAGPELAALLAKVTRLTRPANFLGVPALSVPAGFTRAGLPVGMQLLGRPFDEATLFALGHAYQGATDFHRKTPPL